MWAFIAGVFSSYFFIIPVLIILIVIEAALVENKKPGLAGFLVFVIALLFQIFSDTMQPFTWMANHVFETIGLFLLYLGIGALFAIYKWRAFIGRSMRKVTEKARAYFDDHAEEFRRVATPVDSSVEAQEQADRERDALANRLRKNAFQSVMGHTVRAPIQVNDFKGQIVAWMAFWPVSGLWAIIDDPLARIYYGIVNWMSGLLQGFSNKAYADYEDKYK
jgi:hypothetical protein